MTTQSPFGQFDPPQPMTPRQYATIAAVSFFIAVGLLIFYVSAVPYLVANGADNKFFYVLLVPLGGAAGAFCFGAMRSYATFKGANSSGNLELGGAVVVMVLTVIGGFWLVPDATTFSILCRLNGVHGKLSGGSIRLKVSSTTLTGTFNSVGEAVIGDIPRKFRNEKAVPIFDVGGYQLADPKLQIDLSKSAVDIDVIQQGDPEADRRWLNDQLELMRSALSQSKHDDAKLRADMIIQRYPNNIPALNCIGSVQFYKGQFAAAVKTFTELCKLEPSDSLIRRNLADALHENGEYRLAADELLRLQDGGERNKYRLARAYFYAGEIDKAEKYLEGVSDSYADGQKSILAAALLASSTKGKTQESAVRIKSLMEKGITQDPGYWKNVFEGRPADPHIRYTKEVDALKQYYTPSNGG
jgi:hypothetical protein